MECPDITWNDFSAHIFQEDVMLQGSSNFPLDVEQNKTELVTVGEEMGNLRIELRQQRVNTVLVTFPQFAPIQKRKQKNFAVL